ncbi:MAG: peptide ABC transporter substrate-binding protein [Rhodobacteraceae bacterium]|nr:peptide ABC transporter substrate-binding protein [Paracoccaceae bacterium]
MKLMPLAFGGAIVLSLASVGEAERGSDGHVNIIYAQAASILNPYLSGGIATLEASSMILEPLARYDEDGLIVPWLVDEVPTVANGGVPEDLRSITWKLSKGITWSDGTPVTAADAVFTAEYCLHPDGGCAPAERYSDVEKVEALDDRTIRVTFSVPKPFPYGPFVGAQAPLLQKAQFQGCLGARAPDCTGENNGPIGTGPFRVVEFHPNDGISMEANPNFRDSTKPAFATLTFKGGDATAAARGVLETGDFDYTRNLQVAPEVLARLEAVGKGKIVSGFGTLVERIMVNMTNPSAELGDERSTVGHPHPYLSDINVRKAMSMAIDRQLLSETGYGRAGRPTCSVLPTPAVYVSADSDTCLTQDIEGAKMLLDSAGWVAGSDGVRERDGVRLTVLFQTSTDVVRQDFQVLIKQWWAEIGIKTKLRNIDADVFFGGDPSNPDTFQKFFADVEMYANKFDGTDPEAYMSNWSCAQIPSPDTQWQGNNMPRYCSAEYDQLVVRMAKTADIEERTRLAKEMNDHLMQNVVMIPLVDRGRVSAHATSLGGVIVNTWDSELWNIADWHRIR